MSSVIGTHCSVFLSFPLDWEFLDSRDCVLFISEFPVPRIWLSFESLFDTYVWSALSITGTISLMLIGEHLQELQGSTNLDAFEGIQGTWSTGSVEQMGVR